MTDMYDEVVEAVEIEQRCLEQFGVSLKVKRVLTSDISTSKGSHTTVFEAEKHTLYALCQADEPLVFADVKYIIQGMGMEAEAYLPPLGDNDYFIRHGRQAMIAAYPGRKIINDDETTFYQTLAPYSPALVRIARVHGEIREYFTALQRWQKSLECSYTRIKVQ